MVSLVWLAAARVAAAQDNYEIQVYGADLVPVGATMLELHSNYTTSGVAAAPGLQPSLHALHETIELTHGFSEWLEVGFYFFTSTRSGDGLQWVGNHLRPRIAVPASWGWPVGLSLSQEFGYQRRQFSEDTWTWEIRPIIDQRVGRFYWSLNPVLERSFKGPGSSEGFAFSPNAMVSLDLTRRVNLALEYYGAFGPVSDPLPLGQSSQAIYPAVNLDLGPGWEFNAGVGVGLTDATDGMLFKLILGRRL